MATIKPINDVSVYVKARFPKLDIAMTPNAAWTALNATGYTVKKVLVSYLVEMEEGETFSLNHLKGIEDDRAPSGEHVAEVHVGGKRFYVSPTLRVGF